ncbi:MAG TPA: dockerin type I domain-containing protein [Anaerolineae bacterium]|nr:dockerin type I domain-containing protein [Anaerolineae bacterium]
MKQSLFTKPSRLFFVLLILVVATVTPAAAQDIGIQAVDFNNFLWNPANTLIARGDGTVLTKLNVEGAQQIYGFTLAVGYDASIVKPESVEPGSLLPGTKGVDYFFTIQPGGPALACGGDASFKVNVTYFDQTDSIEGTGDVLEILWRSDPDAAVGDVADICLDGATSQVVDNGGGVGPAVPTINGTITVEPPAIFKFQIALQGGKNSGLVETATPNDIFTDVVINGIYPCDGGSVDLLGFCTFNNATTLPPYTVEVDRRGYLDTEYSFDDPADSTSIYMTAGDLNNDGVINILDIQLMASLINSPVGTSTLSRAADFTGPGFTNDGLVDILDLVLVARNFGKSGPTAGTNPGTSFPF